MKNALDGFKIDTGFKSYIAVYVIMLITGVLSTQYSLYPTADKLRMSIAVAVLFTLLILFTYGIMHWVRSQRLVAAYFSSGVLLMAAIGFYLTRDRGMLMPLIMAGPVFIMVSNNFSMRQNYVAAIFYAIVTLVFWMTEPIVELKMGPGFYILMLGTILSMLITTRNGHMLFWRYDELLKEKIQIAEERNASLYTTISELEVSERTIETQYEEILSINAEYQHIIDQLKAVVKTIDNGIIDIDIERKTAKLSEQAIGILGIVPSEPHQLHEAIKSRLLPKDAIAFSHFWDHLMFEQFKSNTLETRELTYFNGDKPQYIKFKGSVYTSYHPDYHQTILEQHAVLMVKDVTEEYTQAQHIYDMAYKDSLTGLSNRSAFLERAYEAMNLHGLDKVSIMVFDIDNFKYINDTFGFALGDQLLKNVAAPLKSCLEGMSQCPVMLLSVGRFDGDTFGLLISGNNSDMQYQSLYHWLVNLVNQQELEGSRIQLTLSAGVADSDNPQFALTAAEIAMYKAKEKGRATLRVFDGGYLEEVKRHHQISTELGMALRVVQGDELQYLPNTLMLHYQPIIDNETQEVMAFEALARWQHSVLGRVAPDEFIAVAEKTGQIIALGDWVIKEAMRFSKQYGHKVFVNVSPVQLLQVDGFSSRFIAFLDHFGLSRDRIGIEITEGVLVQDKKLALAQLSELRHAGIQVALDDFGSGYSSLNYLLDLPITTLKIDKAFIRPLEANAHREKAIVGTIIQLATQLGLDTVAEGVETEVQHEILKELGCKRSQGYLFSQPISEADIIKSFDAKRY